MTAAAPSLRAKREDELSLDPVSVDVSLIQLLDDATRSAIASTTLVQLNERKKVSFQHKKVLRSLNEIISLHTVRWLFSVVNKIESKWSEKQGQKFGVCRDKVM